MNTRAEFRNRALPSALPVFRMFEWLRDRHQDAPLRQGCVHKCPTTRIRSRHSELGVQSGSALRHLSRNGFQIFRIEFDAESRVVTQRYAAINWQGFANYSVKDR